MWRIHFMLSEVLQIYQEQQYDVAEALIVQLLKVIHQVAIDHGEWHNALLMWPDEDPIGVEEFAGEESEMQQIHGYRRALADLRGKTGRQWWEQRNEENDAERPPRKDGKGDKNKKGDGKGGKNRDRNKDKDREKGDDE